MNKVLKELTKTGTTWNDALSYSTTGTDKGSACLDYFFKCGTYRKRSQADVDVDMCRIFGDDENLALRVVFATRLITRKPKNTDIDEVQTGFGNRDEFYKAITWLHNNKPELLYNNLHLIPVFGSWKDFVNEPLISILDKEKVFALIENNQQDDLLKKYLPQARSSKKSRSTRDKLRSDWAKYLTNYLGVSPTQYRKWKASGKAHIWQKQMQAQKWDDIKFNGIPGKAMALHTSRKGKDKQTVFERHGLVEKLKEWVLSQKSVKFTGYPYELTQIASSNKKSSLIQKLIFNRQFETLLEPFKGHSLGNVLCAIDTSGSMEARLSGSTVSALDICLSLGLVFSSLNIGEFKNSVVAFNEVSTLRNLKGEFCDRLHQLENMETAWGSTNFQSVIDLLVKIRREKPNIPLEDFPTTLLVVSDMQFNPVGRNVQTNYEAAIAKLRSVGLGDIRIIWWNVSGHTSDFPCTMDEPGVYMIGGFDPANLKALLGLTKDKDKETNEAESFKAVEKKEENSLDGMMNVLNQPIFDLLNMGVSV